MSDIAETLFPVFQIPTIVPKEKTAEKKYRSSVAFDFQAGDFVRDGAHRLSQATGREAYQAWCRKVVVTERLSCLAYSSDLGTELMDAFSQPDQKAVESALERTIYEALMVNPQTEYVRGFAFSWRGESLFCTFTVKGREWEEFELTTKIY